MADTESKNNENGYIEHSSQYEEDAQDSRQLTAPNQDNEYKNESEERDRGHVYNHDSGIKDDYNNQGVDSSRSQEAPVPRSSYGRKLFIGGISWNTSDERFRSFFEEQFGAVEEATIMRDRSTGASRGFGFVVFADPKAAQLVLAGDVELDGRKIDPKLAVPRDEMEREENVKFIAGNRKVFVGGLAPETTQEEFETYFSQFGKLIEASLMVDHEGRSRQFGFVRFRDDSLVDEVTREDQNHILSDKRINCRIAQPKRERGGGGGGGSGRGRRDPGPRRGVNTDQYGRGGFEPRMSGGYDARPGYYDQYYADQYAPQGYDAYYGAQQSYGSQGYGYMPHHAYPDPYAHQAPYDAGVGAVAVAPDASGYYDQRQYQQGFGGPDPYAGQHWDQSYGHRVQGGYGVDRQRVPRGGDRPRGDRSQDREQERRDRDRYGPY